MFCVFVGCYYYIAKKQRTIQVMDIHELPKPKAKNAFFAKNKFGGGGSQGRHWWLLICVVPQNYVWTASWVMLENAKLAG